MASTHRWHFHRQGGFDQVVLQSGDDLRALDSLDQKLWVALACPTIALDIDAASLALLDGDGDGRVRAPEVLATVKWMTLVLRDPGLMLKRPDALPLDQIRTDTPEGRTVLDSARRVLGDLGKEGATAIAPADTADTQKIFATTRFNGDGIITAETAETDAHKAAIADVIKALGSDTDRSGKPGINQARVDTFFTEAQAYADHHTAGRESGVLVLGEHTAAAFAAFEAVKAKIEDWFTRGRLAAFDDRAAEHLGRPAASWAGIAERALSADDAAIAEFPIARVAPGQPLSLSTGINPAWAAKIAAFRAQVVAPILGDRPSLTAEMFADLGARLTAFGAWHAAPKGEPVAAIGIERLQALLASDAKAVLTDLIAQDEARRPEANGIAAVDKAVRLTRDLYVFLNNFVTFADFYNPRKRAAFVSGTLYLDGRSCDLTLPVADVGKHSAVAGQSYAYLAYCECTRKGGADKRTIVAAFTNGDSDFLRVGRNGIFYDRAGADWDATIVKVVEAPISIRQAFFAPYKRVARMVSDQIEKFASAREKSVEAGSLANVDAATKQVTEAKAPAPAAAPAAPAAAGAAAPAAPAAAPVPAAASAFDIAKFAGIFAAVGLALGAIGSAIAMVLTGFLGLKLWQMPLAIGATLLLISGPSMLLAFMKLRQRNLGPLLDASGWAINARAKLNVPIGATLTKIAALPEGAHREMSDPYAEPAPKWKKWLFWIVLAVIVSVLLDLQPVRDALGL
jgi:hypothetical protein